MQNNKIQLGFVKPLPKQYRLWYILGVIAFVIFVLFTIYKEEDLFAVTVFLLQIPLVIILSLPSLFPEKEIFQLFVQFTDKQLLFRNNYLKGALIIDYSEIQSIEIKPTKVIIETDEKPIEIPFNTMGYKTTQKIKANFESLKEEINK